MIAPGGVVAGDVEIGPEASVWFNAVVRGDSDRVTVGARTNVQDNAVLHTDPGKPCEVGEDCTIGHGAIVHYLWNFGLAMYLWADRWTQTVQGWPDLEHRPRVAQEGVALIRRCLEASPLAEEP